MPSCVKWTQLIYCLGILCLAASGANSAPNQIRDAFGNISALLDPQFHLAAETLRDRGYQADEFHLVTTTGYVLRLTRGRNPLFSGGSAVGKDPILFVHGLGGQAHGWVANSEGAKPKDFTNISLTETSLSSLQETLGDEPSARSLPIFALNFGHEVWLLDRRGAPGSQRRVGDPDPTNAMGVELLARLVALDLNTQFWNYSLDQQVEIDLPQVVDYVLNSSPASSRISIVGHSEGATLPLMAYALSARELTGKIASTVLWASAFSLFTSPSSEVRALIPLLPVFEFYIGPYPTTLELALIQSIDNFECLSPLTCALRGDRNNGTSKNRQAPACSHEMAQFLQMSKYNNSMHKYDWGPAGNMQTYNQLTPPAYDLSVLDNYSSISFYAGSNDTVVTPSDVAKTRSLLSGPTEYHLLDGFDHGGYFGNPNAPRLAIIPSMREIVTLASG